MRDGTKTKKRLCDSALRLFVEQGVNKTTTREIAAAAGVAEGTLYRHFKSKDALAWELFYENYAAMADLLAEERSRHETFEGTATAIIDSLCAAYDKNSDTFRYLLLAQHNHLERITGDMKSPILVLEDFMRAAAERGDIWVKEPALATAFFLGPLLQTAAALVYGQLPGPISRWAPDIRRAVLRLLQGGEG